MVLTMEEWIMEVLIKEVLKICANGRSLKWGLKGIGRSAGSCFPWARQAEVWLKHIRSNQCKVVD